jgi:hypothetical protein
MASRPRTRHGRPIHNPLSVMFRIDGRRLVTGHGETTPRPWFPGAPATGHQGAMNRSMEAAGRKRRNEQHHRGATNTGRPPGEPHQPHPVLRTGPSGRETEGRQLQDNPPVPCPRSILFKRRRAVRDRKEPALSGRRPSRPAPGWHIEPSWAEHGMPKRSEMAMGRSLRLVRRPKAWPCLTTEPQNPGSTKRPERLSGPARDGKVDQIGQVAVSR